MPADTQETDPTHFSLLAETGEALESTSRRLQLAEQVARFLDRLAPEEVPSGLRLLLGQPFPEWDPRTLNVSGKALFALLREMTQIDPGGRESIAAEAVDAGHAAQLLFERGRTVRRKGPPLTLREVSQALADIAEVAGRGARSRREALVRGLLERASSLEAKYLVKVLLREMRHGVSEGIAMEGIARAASAPAKWVRRANQLLGDPGEVALIALREGEAGLRRVRLRLFRPIKPMLAKTAEDLAEAFARFEGRVALEHKLDGARVQIHAQGEDLRFYSRNLSEVTASLPDVADEVRANLRAQQAVLEGEVVAIDREGRPLPFQDLMRRFRRVHKVEEMVAQVPVQLYLFECLHRDGEDLLDRPYGERWQALQEVAGGLNLVPQALPRDVAEGEVFAGEAWQAGHEGVMAKDLERPYTPGVRGMAWLKLKHVLTLDLVVVAADWGYGRRHGWLSNLHLAVRDESSGTFQVIGKTFKGLTDAEFVEMTERLLSIERSRSGGTVSVEPQVVVEVLFNEIQDSSRYPSGFALRFARVARIREDKSADQVDTLQTLRELYEAQFRYKGRPQVTDEGKQG
jgi:DNA ligase-1